MPKVFAELLKSLDENPSMEERACLEKFINSNSDQYQFPQEYAALMEKLFVTRLSFHQFVFNAELFAYVLQVLQTLRILSRDPKLLVASRQPTVSEINGAEIIGILLKDYANRHFQDFSARYLSEMLVELITTVRRMTDNERLLGELLKHDIPELLTLMLGSTHNIVARATLEALLALSKRYRLRSAALMESIQKTTAVELLLRIISEYEGEFVHLAANLLNTLCMNEEMSRQVRVQRGNMIMLK